MTGKSQRTNKNYKDGYSFTALVVGQFLSEKFSLPATIAGIIFTIAAFAAALILEEVKEG